MAYTDKAQIEAYTGKTVPSSLSSQLADWITAVEEWINSYTGIKFEDGIVSTVRYYDGNGTKTLFIDTTYQIETLYIIDEDGNTEQTLTSADYTLYPLNSTGKNRIELKSDSLSAYWPRGKRVKITGKHAFYSTVPQQVQLVATKLVAKILEQNYQGGAITSQSLGDYSVSYAKVDDEADVLGVKDILNYYRNIEV